MRTLSLGSVFKRSKEGRKEISRKVHQIYLQLPKKEKKELGKRSKLAVSLHMTDKELTINNDSQYNGSRALGRRSSCCSVAYFDFT